MFGGNSEKKRSELLESKLIRTFLSVGSSQYLEYRWGLIMVQGKYNLWDRALTSMLILVGIFGVVCSGLGVNMLAFFGSIIWVVLALTYWVWLKGDDPYKRKQFLSAQKMVTAPVTEQLYRSLKEHYSVWKVVDTAFKYRVAMFTEDENSNFFDLIDKACDVLQANHDILEEKVKLYDKLVDTPKNIFDQLEDVIISNMAMTSDLKDRFEEDLAQAANRMKTDLSTEEFREILDIRKLLSNNLPMVPVK
ncbi:hypothetical protein IPM19_03260 [bacterium]|nr:MAG: hypothetical protein IPM19_03260 [bacterium]